MAAERGGGKAPAFHVTFGAALDSKTCSSCLDMRGRIMWSHTKQPTEVKSFREPQIEPDETESRRKRHVLGWIHTKKARRVDAV